LIYNDYNFDWRRKHNSYYNSYTHQGVEKLIDGAECPNPKYLGLFEGE